MLVTCSLTLNGFLGEGMLGMLVQCTKDLYAVLTVEALCALSWINSLSCTRNFSRLWQEKTLVCTTTDRWCCFVFFIRCILIFCVCNQYPVKFDGQSTPPFSQILSQLRSSNDIDVGGIHIPKDKKTYCIFVIRTPQLLIMDSLISF